MPTPVMICKYKLVHLDSFVTMNMDASFPLRQKHEMFLTNT